MSMTSAIGSAAQDVRRRIEHDVWHELGAIRMLGDVLSESADVGSASRLRARQLVAEVSWLEQLMRLLRDGLPDDAAPAGTPRPVRLDRMLEDVLSTARMNATTQILMTADPAIVRADRVALGRALRNLVWNALAAAGPAGAVIGTVTADGVHAVASIEDDGPGFDPLMSVDAGLGLRTVDEFAAAAEGELRIEGGANGRGCKITLTLPLTSPQKGGAPCAS
jgi:signal transduction histidine kinase